MEAWPLESTKRSRSLQWGLAGLCLRWRPQSATAISAMPMGAPGWPELAFCTASMASARMALAMRECGTVAVPSVMMKWPFLWRLWSSVDLRGQFAFGVTIAHGLHRDWLDVARLSCATERLKAVLAHAHGSLAGVGEEFARVELFRVLEQVGTDGAGHGEPDVCVDIDLAHAMLDGLDDFRYGNTIGFLHLATVGANHFQPFLRYRRGTMHDEVRIG